MKVLQNPPTRQSCPYEQTSIHYRTSFVKDVICNNKFRRTQFIKFTVARKL